MDFETDALFVFIIVALCWCWAWDQFMAHSSDTSEPNPSRTGGEWTSAERELQHRIDANHMSLHDGNRHSIEVASQVKLIQSADSSFDLDRFLISGTLVYETVVAAFANGDRGYMQDLLSDHVYTVFSEIIAQRENRSECVALDFVSMDDARIVEIGLINPRAEITVSFGAEVITVTRAATGTIIAGSPTMAVKVRDLWTFARDLTSSSPAWKVVETRPVKSNKDL